MEIKRIRPEDFPVKRGGYSKSEEEFQKLVHDTLELEVGGEPLDVSSVDWKATSGSGLRSLLIKELKSKRKAKHFELKTKMIENRQHLYIRRVS